MKVELDLSTEQLKQLDTSLVDLIKSLSDEQKTEIIKSYLSNKMDEQFYAKNEYWGSGVKLSNFGECVINGLQEKAQKSISEDLLSKEGIRKEMEQITENITGNLESIVRDSIAQYIINHIFSDKDSVEQIVRNNIYNYLSNRG